MTCYRRRPPDRPERVVHAARITSDVATSKYHRAGKTGKRLDPDLHLGQTLKLAQGINMAHASPYVVDHDYSPQSCQACGSAVSRLHHLGGPFAGPAFLVCWDCRRVWQEFANEVRVAS